MKLKDIYKELDIISPFELQEKWDNSGLQVGSYNDEVNSVVLSMDIDEELVNSIKENSLVITHHPLIFSPLKQINYDQFPSSLIQKMIKKNISNIAMHTNFDKTHLNRYVLEEILGFKISKEDDFTLYAEVDETLSSLSKKVKNLLNIENLKVVSVKDNIKTIALCTGSGASLLENIDADCFLTGDIKYHDAMLAVAKNISMIDIGHYESECFFAQILQTPLKNLGIDAIMATTKNPFKFL
ncbi:MAG: Nif3-like dinuclear metal center hexameric protein [Helicobacteraceae bacterium]|nr:Nif3-like dinuclear metal center hexameric protein [Helicobacteraceae bacterium]